MPDVSNTPAQFSAEFEHPNEVSDVIPWDLDFRQICGSPGKTMLVGRNSRTLSAVRVCFPSRIHQVGCSPPNMLTFGVPNGRSRIDWLDRETPTSPIVCFGDGQSFDGVSEMGFEALIVSLPTTEIVALADDFGLTIPDESLTTGAIGAAERPRAVQKFAKTLVAFLGSNTVPGAPLDDEDVALTLLLALSAGDAHKDRSRPRLRELALQRALGYLACHDGESIKIRELCRECGVSWRTLDRAFAEHFGVGPKAYANALRLNRLRLDLFRGATAGSIANAANRWGFWHMGQLAKDYRKLFGRLPSEDHQSVERIAARTSILR